MLCEIHFSAFFLFLNWTWNASQGPFKCFCSPGFNYSWSICRNFCHRFSPSFCWIIDGPFPLPGVQEDRVHSGFITGQGCQRGCNLFLVFTRLDSLILALIYLLTRWLWKCSNHFTKSSTSLWFTLQVTPWLEGDTCRFFGDKWQCHMAHLRRPEIEESLR